jgi:uncharacterized OB-fold protein
VSAGVDRPPLAAFADGCRDGRLLFTVDADGRPVSPPRAGLAWAESTGLGTVYATTTARPRDGEPYDVSLVELDEGARLMSRVEGVAPEAVAVGLRVRVAFAEGDPPVPVFRPA